MAASTPSVTHSRRTSQETTKKVGQDTCLISSRHMKNDNNFIGRQTFQTNSKSYVLFQNEPNNFFQNYVSISVCLSRPQKYTKLPSADPHIPRTGLAGICFVGEGGGGSVPRKTAAAAVAQASTLSLPCGTGADRKKCARPSTTFIRWCFFPNSTRSQRLATTTRRSDDEYPPKFHQTRKSQPLFHHAHSPEAYNGIGTSKVVRDSNRQIKPSFAATHPLATLISLFIVNKTKKKKKATKSKPLLSTFMPWVTTEKKHNTKKHQKKHYSRKGYK